jgi:hypothetical protein
VSDDDDGKMNGVERRSSCEEDVPGFRFRQNYTYTSLSRFEKGASKDIFAQLKGTTSSRKPICYGFLNMIYIR